MNKFLLLPLIIFLSIFTAIAQEQQSSPYIVDFESNYSHPNHAYSWWPQCWRIWSMQGRNASSNVHGSWGLKSNVNQPKVQIYTCFFDATTTDTFSFYFKVCITAAFPPYSDYHLRIGRFDLGTNANIPSGVIWFDTLNFTDSNWVHYKANFPVNGIQKIVLYANEADGGWNGDPSTFIRFDYFRTSATPLYSRKPAVHIKQTAGGTTACNTENRTFVADTLKNVSTTIPSFFSWYRNSSQVHIASSLTDTTYTTNALVANDTTSAIVQTFDVCYCVSGFDIDTRILKDTSNKIVLPPCRKITLQATSADSICPGASLQVDYTTSAIGNWPGGTQVRIELSDVNIKTWTSPITLGTGSLSESTVNIAGTLNVNLAAGKYYIRGIATTTGTVSEYYDSIIVRNKNICQRITIVDATPNNQCPGNNISIDYNTTASMFWPVGTQIRFELSDRNAKTWTTPIVIGTGPVSTVTNNVTGTLALSVIAGKYYIRGIATSNGTTSEFLDSITIDGTNICQRITIVNVLPDDLCPGNSFSVEYNTSPTANWPVGTQIRFELSDPDSKSWVAPTTIDTGNVSTSTVNVNGTLSGSMGAARYYIRGISTTNGTTSQYFDSITVNPIPINSATVYTVKCRGENSGSIDLSASSGHSPYTYSWSTGATTQDVYNLFATSYQVTTTDAKGCRDVDSYTVPQSATVMNLALDATTNVNCFGGNSGAVSITVTGGVTPYTYIWSNNATTMNISSVIAGSYTVSASDANGCVRTLSIPVTEPGEIIFNSSVAHVTCLGGANGSIMLTTSGGTTPYSFSWDNGATTEDLSSLAPGPYVLTARDNKFCQKVFSTTISEPSILGVSGNITHVTVFGGTDGAINISVTGGTPGYAFQWSNNATTEDNAGIGSGTYFVTITDTKGCRITNGYTVNQPGDVIITYTSSPVSCNGGNNGAIDVSVSGGVSPYSFVWSTGQVSEDLSSLAANDYIITVTDNNSAYKIALIKVTEPSAIAIIRTISQVSCYGGNDGAIDISISGGKTPYSYSWNTGAVTQDLSGLSVGSFSVTVSDLNSCTGTTTAAIVQPDSIQLSGTITDANCFGCNTGAIDISTGGGTLPFSFYWNTGSTTQNLSTISAGDYSITVTDANGCTKKRSFHVTQTDPLSVVIVPVRSWFSSYILADKDTAICYQSSIILHAVAKGGTRNYSSFTYLWRDLVLNTNVGNDSIIILKPENTSFYSVAVNDGLNTARDTSIVFVYPGPTVRIYATYEKRDIDTVDEDGNKIAYIINGQEFQFDVKGGDRYRWSPEDGLSNPDIPNPTAKPTKPLFYSVSVDSVHHFVTDSLICTAKDSIEIIFKNFEVYVPTAFTPNNDETNDKMCVRGIGIKENINFRIYNRWGELVFESQNLNDCWDGKFRGAQQHMQTFGYLLEVEDLMGEKHKFNGIITIMR